MSNAFLTALNTFLGRASKATYASGGGEADAWRTGFTELDYRENSWHYRDSYSGYLRSWGQEVVWHEDEPVWTCLYGGGMTADSMDSNLADKTFAFLKKALSEGEKETIFQPRGPKVLKDGSWQYHCEVKGSIEEFSGRESISHNGKIVFMHDFFGGVVVS